MNNRTATKAFPVVQMNLTDIVIDADLRYREINPAHTRDLLNALRRSDSLAAVLVWIDDRPESPTLGKPLLVDGGHRLAAYKNAKRESIPCRIITGTFAEAVGREVKHHSPRPVCDSAIGQTAPAPLLRKSHAETVKVQRAMAESW